VDVPVFAANDGGVADRNPYYGHVVYTPGRGLDHPLAVTRYNYTFRSDAFTGQQIARQTPAPFTIMAFWNARGDPSVGAFTNGARLICNPPTSQSACVGVVWLFYFSAYDRNRGITWDNWQGTILEEKRDKSGLAYMRNRYYDPATGRFTQEDPIGLGGGLNLYGFANGDPINYSDPFGLCPICAAAAVILAEAAEGAVVGAVTGAGERILLNRLSGRPTFEGVGKTALEGAAVGAVTAGVGSAIRIARAVGLAKSATEATETAVASRAEAEAAGELHVGSERVEMVDRTTGSFKGYRNPKTGARYRPEPGQDHVNLENDQGGNVHVKFPDQ